MQRNGQRQINNKNNRFFKMNFTKESEKKIETSLL